MEFSADYFGRYRQAVEEQGSEAWRSLRLQVRGKNLWRLMALVTAILNICNAFNLFAFSVLLSDFREVFQYSQVEAELIMGMNMLGLGATLPAGLVVQKFGIRVAQGIALATAGLGYFLIYSSVKNVDFYTDHVYLVMFYFFIAGSGCGFSFNVAMATTVRNYSRKYRSTVVGVLTAACNIGGIIYIALYNGCFSSVSRGDSHIGGYFLTVALSSSVCNAVGLFLYGYFPPSTFSHDVVQYLHAQDDDSDDDNPVSHNKNYDAILQTAFDDAIHNRADDDPPVQSFKQLLQNPTFHMLAWPCIIALSLESMNMGNLSTYLRSFDMMRYLISFGLVSPIISIFGKVLLGYFSDKLANRFPRAGWIFILSSLNIFSYVVAIFAMSSATVIALNLTIWNLFAVAASCNTNTLLVEEFGMESFARNSGFVYFGNSIIAFFLLLMFGAFYQLREAVQPPSDSGHEVCVGEACFLYTFAIAGFMTITATVLTGFYILRRQRRPPITMTEYEYLLSEDE